MNNIEDQGLPSYTEAELVALDKKLYEISKLSADKQPPLTENEKQMVTRITSNEKNINKYIETIFVEQEKQVNKQEKQEIEDYSEDFSKISKEISEQEKKLKDMIEEFNTSKNVEQFEDVIKTMNDLLYSSRCVGGAIKKTDTNAVINSLSSYDTLYDETSVRKIIKKLN